MALDVTRLSNAFKATFVANGAANNAATAALCLGLAQNIVDEFTNHAEVIPTTGSPPMTVVVAGTPTPVAGKGRVT